MLVQPMTIVRILRLMVAYHYASVRKYWVSLLSHPRWSFLDSVFRVMYMLAFLSSAFWLYYKRIKAGRQCDKYQSKCILCVTMLSPTFFY